MRPDYNEFYLKHKCKFCKKPIIPAWKYCSEECNRNFISKKNKQNYRKFKKMNKYYIKKRLALKNNSEIIIK